MSKDTIYIHSSGRMSQKDNTILFTRIDEESEEETGKKYLPVEQTEELHIFSEVRTNSQVFRFFGKKDILVHYYDFYGNYSGSFVPRPVRLSGNLHIRQAEFYLKKARRTELARLFVAGGADNMLRNLKYRLKREADVGEQIDRMEALKAQLPEQADIPAIMGIEGNIRMSYYEAFDRIITADFRMEGRSKRPPQNEVNALISFLNSLCYTLCIKQIHRTALDPSISFLHEPGNRRFSLALDLAEIFKPVFADRLLFTLLNTGQLSARHFDKQTNYCRLTTKGMQTVQSAWGEMLRTTFMHRKLNRKVSYEQTVRLECYKLIKHLLGEQPYEPFKSMW